MSAGRGQRIASALCGALMNVVVAAGIGGMVACQVYTPVVVSPATAGTEVRVTLSDQGTASLGNSLGYGAKFVEGRLTTLTDSTVGVAVTQVTRISGIDETWKGEAVTVPRSGITTIERRETSVTRSLLVAGAVVGGALLAARAGTGSQVGSPGGGPPSTGK